MTISRVLITGAAGALGRQLRAGLAGRYPLLRLSDIAAMDPAQPGEEIVTADLADVDATARLCEGVDAIVHFGGQSLEAEWATVIAANITGLVNLYEGARKAGVGRVVFAGSNHAIGLYRRTQRLDHLSPARPDSRYGVSKAFGEDLAAYYAYKHGIRSLCLRIGSCFATPRNARMLSTWLSYPDLIRLVEVGLNADYVFEVVYGVSRNSRSWWDNSNAYRLGYAPEDDAERFAAEVEHIVAEDPLDEAFQGGGFVPPDFDGDMRLIP